jgi:hypothetical protein
MRIDKLLVCVILSKTAVKISEQDDFIDLGLGGQWLDENSLVN